MDDLTRLRLMTQLKADEELRLTPYLDSVGVSTIGYGHNLARPLSPLACEVILRDDLTGTEKELAGRLPWASALAGPRYAVLLAMAFNLGVGGLLTFEKFLTHVQAGEYADAALEMADSLWARQVGARAQRLAAQMVSGAWA